MNFHGAPIPRGWQRTYPNLLSTEGVYGAEWYNNVPTFTNQAASHNATLPFTRNVIGPMDYTPCAFSDSQHPHITSKAHELALTVLFESGLQHLADKPESYLAQPQAVQDFFTELPNVWDETRFVAGYPGKGAVLARRSGDSWYVAGINGLDEAQTFSLDLSFIKSADKIQFFADAMKQKYAVIILFALIIVSGITSFSSYQATERMITEDMKSALTKTLAEQQSDVISTDTIRVFNSFLTIEQLRGNAVLAVTTRQNGLRCEAKCSAATIFSMSDQKPASVLWTIALLWSLYCFWKYRKNEPLIAFGGLAYSEIDKRFYNAKGKQVKLTPMQQQLMEMFFHNESHHLTKAEICDTLWPKKDDANDTLYTLIRRLKPIIEEHSDLMIESDRGRAYELKIK